MRNKTKTRALSLLLALVMVLGALPGTARAADVKSVSSAEEFANMEPDGSYLLMEDIEIAAPYGSISKKFAGTFDGNGHTITLKIEGSANLGAFAVIGTGGTVRNLITAGTVNATATQSCAGGIAGQCEGLILNCGNAAVISGKRRIGGIAGQLGSSSSPGTITNCYNISSISSSYSSACATGGIAGYTQNSTISTCYNDGTITANMQVGAISGFLTGDNTSVKHCYWKENCVVLKTAVNNSGFGFGSGTDDCKPYADVDTLLEDLNSNKDSNAAWKLNDSGRPVLDLHSAGEIDTTPKLTLSPEQSTIYKESGAGQNEVTLTARGENIPKDAQVSWTADNENAVQLVPVSNSSSTIRVLPVKGGTAEVKASVTLDSGELSAVSTITVIPHITTVQLSEEPVAGEAVTAKVYIQGGDEYDYENFPALSFQWKYLTGEDYSAGNTGSDSYHTIDGAIERTLLVPEELAGDYLSLTVRYGSVYLTPGSPQKILTEAPEEPDPQPPTPSGDIAEALKTYTMYPVWGKDTNVNEMLKKYLADKGLGSFDISIRSVTQVYGGADIGENGDITYFYADPNTTPAVRMGSCRVTFALDGQPLEREVPVILYWDRARVEAAMTSEILDKVSLPAGEVSGELSLPKVVNGKKWALIQWTSDNAAISISEESQSAADTLFAPYAGIVRQGTKAEEVTLTAKFTFQLTNDIIGIEKPIVLYKTFNVTVPAMDTAQTETIRRQLLDKLEAGFAEKGLTDAVTGDRLTPDEHGIYTTAHDIQLPTTRDFGVDGRYYPVTITSGSPDVLQAPGVNNAARVEVCRPMEQEAQATFTVTLQDKDTSVTASKEFTVRVPALTQAEIDAELALMKEVQEHYFEGIRGDNTSRDNVRTDLSPFFEAYRGTDGQLVWVRSSEEKTGQGIVPVPMDGWEELELWRLFKSSNPNVISHEDLKVTRQAEAKAVTVTSLLSSETLGRYGELYARDKVKYAQYEPLAALYQQPVTTDASIQPAGRMARAAAAADTLIVRGTRDPESTVPVAQTLDNVTFSLTGLDGEMWFSASFPKLAETSTVYDILTRALTEQNGYTVRNKGTYIQAISVSGQTLEEKQYGENSGWMYRVNGKIPNTYAGAYFLRSGDQVEVFYTRDASREVDNWSRPSGGNSGSSDSSSGGTENRQAVRVERTDGGNTYTVTLPKGSSGPQLVSIPNVTQGQLVAIVHADGREEVVKKSILADGRAKFLLEQDAAVKIVDYTNPFRDVSGSAWYSSAVDFASGRGLFSGVSPDTFAPDLPLSRGMLAAVLCRLEEPDIQAAKPGFTDTDSGAWYAEGIAWAAEAGIVCGYGDGRFGPDDSVMREQLAVMLYRYARLLGISTGGRDSLSGFSDSGAVSPWAQEAVAWAVDSGIITGLPDGTLAPAGTATRAEAAAMLQRLVITLLK